MKLFITLIGSIGVLLGIIAVVLIFLWGIRQAYWERNWIAVCGLTGVFLILISLIASPFIP